MRKRTPSGKFMDTINPLMSFSSDDIANMDKEVSMHLFKSKKVVTCKWKGLATTANYVQYNEYAVFNTVNSIKVIT